MCFSQFSFPMGTHCSLNKLKWQEWRSRIKSQHPFLYRAWYSIENFGDTLPPPSLSHITKYQMRITFLKQSSTKPSTLKPASGNIICTVGENTSDITSSWRGQHFQPCLQMLGPKRSHVPCCGTPDDKGLMCMFQIPTGCGANQRLLAVTDKNCW